MRIIPILDARSDVASCDYPLGGYECGLLALSSGSVLRVSHRINGAPALSALIASGAARFAVEVRSPATFTSQFHRAEPRESCHDLTIDADVLARDGGQALPVLIAAEDCSLALADCTDTWQQIANAVPVKAGQWLARAQHFDLSTPQQSLITFVADDAVKRGELRRQFVHSEYPHYEISINSADLAACTGNEGDPAGNAVVLAAWTSALADAHNQPAFVGGGPGSDDGKEPLGDQLTAMIKSADPDCPAPGDDDYDPLRAATLLSGNELVVFKEDDEEDHS